MVAALTWGDSFDLRERFNSAWSSQSLPDRWQPATEQQTLNVLKGLARNGLGSVSWCASRPEDSRKARIGREIS